MANFSSKIQQSIGFLLQNVANSKEKCPRLKNNPKITKKHQKIQTKSAALCFQGVVAPPQLLRARLLLQLVAGSSVRPEPRWQRRIIAAVNQVPC
jgi:hypothetical protein